METISSLSQLVNSSKSKIVKIRFRSGLEEKRQNIIPKIGEPIFVEDTKLVYIGDGETPGGIPVSLSTEQFNKVNLISVTKPIDLDDVVIRSSTEFQNKINRDEVWTRTVLKTSEGILNAVNDSSFKIHFSNIKNYPPVLDHLKEETPDLIYNEIYKIKTIDLTKINNDTSTLTTLKVVSKEVHIPQFSLVSLLNDSDLKLYDSITSSVILGISLDSSYMNNQTEVATSGPVKITDLSNLIPETDIVIGADYYLDPTNNKLSTSRKSSYRVGRLLSPTLFELRIEKQDSIQFDISNVDVTLTNTITLEIDNVKEILINQTVLNAIVLTSDFQNHSGFHYQYIKDGDTISTLITFGVFLSGRITVYL